MKILLAILVCYFIGNFSSGYFLGKFLKNVDIREHGSGNAGATNALRVFGVKIGLLTFIIDVLKGICGVYIGKLIMGDPGALVGGISVVVGHNWPAILGFKGGKGIATSMGVVLSISPITAIISIVFGVLVVAKTKFVSLGSITGAIIIPIIGIIINRPFDIYFVLFYLILSLMAIYRHKGNIKRLINGNERKLGEKAK